ncbi:MAG: hypothetical protein RMJ55_19960, partial [Roseiflexaceae bacterium]|nr:hypothetical protein [Roseiflexaceae bacterium]
MLFCEPKIPKSLSRHRLPNRATPFQCSSASRKFRNLCAKHPPQPHPRHFSALLRAENSEICTRAAVQPNADL